MAEYDYVVIGAGHNGLVAATLLARAGASVLVVEARPTPGGEASASSYRGSWYPRIAYALGLMPRDLAALLGVDLEYSAHWIEPSWVAVVDGVEWLRWWGDPERLENEFAEHGVRDGWRILRGVLEHFYPCAARTGLLYTTDPPGLSEASELLESCWPGLGEALEEPWAAWAGSLIGDELAEALTYPVFLWEPGYTTLYFNMNLARWGIARRGFSALAHQLEAAARRAGAEIVYGAKATVEVRECRATGILLGSSKKVAARRGVVLAASILCLPRLVSDEALEACLERGERRILLEYSSRSCAIDRLNLAFESRPTTPIQLSPPPILSIEWKGVSGEAIYPTLHEPPKPGSPHIVSFSGATTLNPQDLGMALAGMEPVWWESITREVLEREYCNPNGGPNHIPMTRDHILDRRPLPGWASYRTPIDGLYHASASSHPGGQVTGIPGHNAAVRALVDIGVKPPSNLIPRRH